MGVLFVPLLVAEGRGPVPALKPRLDAGSRVTEGDDN